MPKKYPSKSRGDNLAAKAKRRAVSASAELVDTSKSPVVTVPVGASDNRSESLAFLLDSEPREVANDMRPVRDTSTNSTDKLQSANMELAALNKQLNETLNQGQTASVEVQNVLDSLEVATLLLDKDLQIRFFTPAAKQAFGLILTDVGRPLADLKSLVDDDDLLANAAIALRDGVPVEREISGPDQSWFQRRILPYIGQDNEIDGVVITFTNITERRATAAALEEARNAAVKANHSKSRFLSVVSEDMRQPLQALTLIQNLLLETVKDDKAQALIERFGVLVNATSGMLNSLLDISQIETGVIEGTIAPFAAKELCDRLQSEFGPLAVSQGIDLRVIRTAAILMGDAQLLEVMLRHLLANALRYSRAGGKIVLGCRNSGEMVRIEVWDTGIGIAQDELDAIFEEFYQIEDPTLDRERGFGLGLTIVRQLGQLLGHDVQVRSWPGKGSVFSIAVPRGAPDAGPISAIDPSTTARTSSGRTIALVEDDPDVAAMLETLLTEAGHTVISAIDGPTALELTREGAIRPDLVLTDYNLPGGMNGIEVLANLRTELEWDVPCIVLTGDISTGTSAEIELAGCYLLSKPVAAGDLHAAIQKLTPQARQPRGCGAKKPSRLVCVVKDIPAIRETMRSVLEYEEWPVTVYPDAEAFLTAEATLTDQCLIIDNDLPGMSGLALIEHLCANRNLAPAILMTDEGDIAMAVKAVRAGASDFIERPVDRRDLIDSIERAISHTPAGRARNVPNDAVAQRLAALTARQKAVLELVMAGQPSKNIAVDLGISQRTVEVHRAQIMQKLSVRTIPDLVRAVLSANPS